MILALLQIAVTIASLQGRVVEWGATTPIAGAEVELDGMDGTSRIAFAVTSINGEFHFSNIPPGRYRLISTRTGYVQGEYGQRRPDAAGTPLAVSAAQTTGLTIQMAAGGAISGRAMDREGQAAPRTTVSAVRLSFIDGRSILTTAQSTLTDDRGEYRLFWLAPGAYYVNFLPRRLASGAITTSTVNPNGLSAQPWAIPLISTQPILHPAPPPSTSLAEHEVDLPIYFPGTVDLSSASLINVRSGDDIRDVTVSSIVRTTGRVRVTAFDAATGAAPGPSVTVVLTPLAPAIGLRTTQRIGASVTFEDVVPGPYEVSASVYESDLGGRARVDVTGGDLDVAIPLAVLNVAGKVDFVNASTSDSPEAELILRGEPEFRKTVNVAGNNAFIFPGLLPGEYDVTLSDRTLQDWYVRSITRGTADILNGGLHLDAAGDPLSIVLDAGGGILRASVVNNRGEPVPQATVVLVPKLASSVRRPDLYKTATTDTAGRVEIRAIAPGEYDAYGWLDVDSGAWFDPKFLNLFSDYRTSLHVAQGQILNANILCIN